RSDALLIRWTNSGTLRTGGGAYERRLLMLWMYGPDGLLTRYEQFDADCDHEALARFEELTAGPADVRFAAAPPRVAKKLERRVRSNAASANAARLEAAIAARDPDALPTLLAERAEVVDHPPDAPARDRAAPTARAIATALMRGPLDLEWWATAFSPSLEHVDRRKLALWSSRGADAFLGAIRTMVDLSERFENRVDDVVALRSDALLARITTLGTDRASGGAYEMPFLAVVV